MVKYLKYLPLGLFFAFITKLMISGVSFTDAPIILVLGSVACFYEYKAQDQKQSEILKRMDENDKVILAYAKALDEVRTNVASLKLSQGFRSVANK